MPRIQNGWSGGQMYYLVLMTSVIYSGAERNANDVMAEASEREREILHL